ncbi:amidohydrolase family protein [Pseudomonas sp. SH1-B]
MSQPGAAPLCDCHIHVFAPGRHYPGASYQPPGKSIAAFREEAQVPDMGRAVLVQASIDGTDNSHLLEVLRSSTDLELRGVVMIDEDTGNLAELAAAGVRGIRIQDRTRLGINDLPRLPALAARAAEQDWHVELNTEPQRYAALQAQLGRLPAGQALVLDHCGQIDPASADDLAGLSRLLDSGRVWVKLAPTRVSRQPGRYDDLAPALRHLLGQYRERCLWGSDWPHVMTAEPLPQSADMLALLRRELDSAQLQACLVDNPALLYRF